MRTADPSSGAGRAGRLGTAAVLVALALAATALVLALARRDGVSQPPLHPEPHSAASALERPSESSSRLEAGLQSLRVLVGRLADEQDVLRRKLDGLALRPESPAPPPPTVLPARRTSASGATAVPDLAAATTGVRADAVADPLAAVRQFERRLVDLYEGQLASEPGDPGWAWATERQLAASAAEEELGLAEVVRTDCGSTMCALRLRFVDAEALRRFELRWRTSPGWAELGEAFLKKDDLGDLTIDIYIARGGHSFPSLPSDLGVGAPAPPEGGEP